MKLVYILFIIIIAFKELIPLINKNMKKESIFVLIILSWSLLTIFGDWLSIPSILAILYKLISPITKSIFK